jgi:hypothetical protein
MSRSVDRTLKALIRERAIKGTQFLGCIKRGSACGKGHTGGGYDPASIPGRLFQTPKMFDRKSYVILKARHGNLFSGCVDGWGQVVRGQILIRKRYREMSSGEYGEISVRVSAERGRNYFGDDGEILR